MSGRLLDRIREFSQSRPSRAALCFRKEQVTYGQLWDRVCRSAGKLSEAGVRPGECAAYSALSRPSSVIVYLAIQYIGGIAVHIDKNAAPSRALAVCEEAGASVFLTDMKMNGTAVPDHVHLLSLKQLTAEGHGPETERPEEDGETDLPAAATGDEDIAELIFTSGTTGRPKGVMLSCRAVMSITEHTRTGIGIRPDDAVLIPLPLHHSYGLRVLRAVLAAGATAVLQNGFAFAGDIEKNLDRWNCTGFAAVPASMELLREQMKDRFYEIMGRFRYIEIGAGALTQEQRKRLSARLPETALYNTWGSSETGGAVFTDVHEAVRKENTVTTIGKPLPDIEVRIADEHGAILAHTDEEHPGRMQLRGAMLMSGYWNRPDLTAETLRDGWLMTGDMVWRDGDGFLYMLGRADDLINVGGEKVSPVEIENIASEYPYLRECACIGVKEETKGLGQVPVLYLAVRRGYTEEGLVSFLSDRLERLKMPAAYRVVEAIPRNRMQKIDRRAIRTLWESEQAAGETKTERT